MQRDKQADIRQHSRGDRLAYDRVRDISLFSVSQAFCLSRKREIRLYIEIIPSSE